MARLPDGEKTLRICITVYTEYQRVTDGQIDGQTNRQFPRHSPRYAYASRGKNEHGKYLRYSDVIRETVSVVSSCRS